MPASSRGDVVKRKAVLTADFTDANSRLQPWSKFPSDTGVQAALRCPSMAASTITLLISFSVMGLLCASASSRLCVKSLMLSASGSKPAHDGNRGSGSELSSDPSGRGWFGFGIQGRRGACPWLISAALPGPNPHPTRVRKRRPATGTTVGRATRHRHCEARAVDKPAWE